MKYLKSIKIFEQNVEQFIIVNSSSRYVVDSGSIAKVIDYDQDGMIIEFEKNKSRLSFKDEDVDYDFISIEEVDKLRKIKDFNL